MSNLSHNSTPSDLSGSQWLPKAELEKVLVETIEDIEYDNFVNAMTRLSSLPFSYRVKEFIYTYRKPLIADSTSNEIPKPNYDEQGRMVITTYGEFNYSSLFDGQFRCKNLTPVR